MWMSFGAVCILENRLTFPKSCYKFPKYPEKSQITYKR